MTAAFDASALVKLFLREPGSSDALALWTRADRVFSPRVTYVEARAALSAARRGRRITTSRLGRAVTELAALWEGVDAVELDQALAEHAADLTGEHALGGPDAIQLASALRTGAVLVSWDERLRAAALAEGLALAPAA